jgi:pimeloyl-ACP methyl ester carboxylesterase
LFLDREKFAASFAADVAPREAAFMADSQVPWGVEALNGTVTNPAWRQKPSWYMVTTEDRMIPPALQRTMVERAGATSTEVAGSHAIYVSQPSAVAELIAEAAQTLARTDNRTTSLAGRSVGPASHHLDSLAAVYVKILT